MPNTFWLKNSKLTVDNAGHPILCDRCPCEVCQYVAQLHAQAEEHGWTWHEEGLVLHLAEYGSASSWKCGDWYVRATVPYYGDYRNCLCCAESADALYVVPCGCSGIETLSKSSYDGHDLPQGYWRYIDYDGACDCVDDRELYLLYPDIFGIQDLSWGSNTKYGYEYEDWGTTYTAYDMVGSKSRVNGYDYERYDSFLDYRTLCYIVKVFDTYGNEQMRLGRLSPPGSPQTTSTNIATYSRIWFDGVFQPFTKDSDVSWDYTGQHLQWNWSRTSMIDDPSVSHESACGISAYDIPHYAPRVSPPSIPSGTGDMQAVIYREQWIQTSRGIMLYGEDNYAPSFVEYGINGSHGNPDWRNCYGHSGVPRQDATVTATLIDTDMHWCHNDFEMPMEDV